MSASFEQRSLAVGLEQPRTDFFLEDPVVLARAFTDWPQADRPTRVQS